MADKKNSRGINKKTLMLVQFSILLAIEAVFCFTVLGSIPFTPVVVATLAMIPVIITGMLLGVKAGTLMGFFAGLFSFIVWTFMPPSALAFVFSPVYAENFIEVIGSLFICFVPRILVGTVAGALYNHMSKTFSENNAISYIIGATLGSLTNTALVVAGIALFFGERVSGLMGDAIMVIVNSLIIFNGVPEAIVSAIICPAVCIPVRKIFTK
ncbi:MAG: ECF transporter S component [Oscillospiraceae bacterium]|nr:ECF transporter S component [Oscillospiraceae bacterium]